MYNNRFNEEIRNELNLSERCISVGYKINSTTKENINNTLLNTIGISYDEFAKLDFYEQQKIIKQYHKKNSYFKGEISSVMVGNGEHSAFIKSKNGEKVMIGSGEHSCFVESGVTLEERITLDDKIDDIIYNKPVALVKKIVRRIQK